MANTTQRFFDDGPDAICIADSQFMIQHVNVAFERLFGFNRDELRGTPIWNIADPGRRETAERVLRSVPDEGIKRVWPFPTKSGKFINLAIHCIRSPSGSYLATFREVIENRDQDRKRLSAERALTFLEYAPIPMYELDDRGVVTLWNRAMTKLFDLTPEEAVGKRILDILTSSLSPEQMGQMQKDLNATGRADVTATYQSAKSRPIPSAWSFVRMSDDTGKTLGIAVTGFDLTDTIQKERELQESFNLIKAQRDELRALSTPILEVWNHVLALPVVGALDGDRAMHIMQELLEAISRRDCRFAILDLTGVVGIDESSAAHLVSILRAIALLGASGIVTGLRPATAKTMVECGIDFASVATFPTLQTGLRHCLDELRQTSKSRPPAAGRSPTRIS